MTKNKSKPQRGIAVKRAEEKEAQLNWCWTEWLPMDNSKQEVEERDQAPPGHTRISRSRQFRRRGVPASHQQARGRCCHPRRRQGGVGQDGTVQKARGALSRHALGPPAAAGRLSHEPRQHARTASVRCAFSTT